MKTKFQFFLASAHIVLLLLALGSTALAATSTDSSSMLTNPLPVAHELYCPTAACDLKDMVLYIMGDILKVVPIFSVLFIIVGAFKMIMSHGNEEAITSAKKTITWAIIGLVVALMAFSIVAIVQNFLGVTIR